MAHFHQAKESRRAFLRRAAHLSAVGGFAPLALNLAAIGDAAALTATDYRALVCVFLNGGNDHANTVVPYDSASYSRYAQLRSSVALARSALAPTRLVPSVVPEPGKEYALHPSMGGLAALFNSGKLAIQFNVGPLIVPTTRADFRANRVALPPQLASHNDQASYWQSFLPEGAAAGWGGKLGELALAANGNSNLTCISASGNALFLVGNNASSLQVSPSGIIELNTAPLNNMPGVRDALQALLQQGSTHMLENEYMRISAEAINTARTLNPLIRSTSLPVAIPGGSLGSQLAMVAKLAAISRNTGLKRQVFFVSIGGFDTHGDLLNTHGPLMQTVSDALAGFYAALQGMGLSDSVTAFTASDFGRTLSANGDGSDHGWGGHHLVLGGAVRGGRFYGKAPPLSVGDSTTAAEDQWHVGQGRLLPSTSLDQFAATLAQWFGAGSNELDALFPNLRNFGGADYPKNLGFMAT